MARFKSMHRAKCLGISLNVCFLFLIFSTVTSHLLSIERPESNPVISFHSEIVASNQLRDSESDLDCIELHRYEDKEGKCSYVKSHDGCQPRGYIPYLQLFYCTLSSTRTPLGYTLLILWLILLFYLLGDTAANYFCSSLEGLSTSLRLSPTVAGVTLLSLGNGSPDVFASVISFMGDGGRNENVGLNGVLGGAFFVSSIVVGIISFSAHSTTVGRHGFIRDVLFLLLALACLLAIIIYGKINLWVALSFLSLYFIYVLFVCCLHKEDRVEDTVDESLVLPIKTPLLDHRTEDNEVQVGGRDCRAACFGHKHSVIRVLKKLGHILELPLYLPRRLTIPVVSSERWSKPFAVISVTMAPLLLAVIWNSISSKSSLLIYAIGGSVGIIFGFLVFLTTEISHPPRKCLIPWLAGGFVMSITWTYILAQELISLLVSLGLIFGISSSILGLTVLAWGNSLGDLVANVTMAKSGGPGGSQVAISGCYAGPMFNIVVGLGLSLALSAWSVYPSPYIIARNTFVYETIGFLMAGLLWALVIIPKKKMRLDKFLGGGLFAIYLCFLSLKMARTLGLLEVQSHPSS